MTVQVIITVHHIGPHAPTIWEALATKLGREPTSAEAVAEVRRILSEASDERLVRDAAAGRLPWQRKRRA